MKEQPSSHQNQRSPGTGLFSTLYTNPISFVALLLLSYLLLLTVSYSLGYSRGSSFSNRDISTYVISTTTLNTQLTAVASSELETQCADPVSPELIRQTVIDLIYNGTSPYEDFIPPRISLPFNPKRIKGWSSYGAVYKRLIQRVRPKTIIKFSTSFGSSATYMANLTSQLDLKTQILCLDDFHGWPGVPDLSEDIAMPNGGVMLLHQFMQNVISHNANESILPVPISTVVAVEKLCEWGIFGDLIEVATGRDFHSAWSDINRAFKLLRPGGVLFGHNFFTSNYNKGVRQAVRLFAQVNNFQVKSDGQHWMIDSA